MQERGENDNITNGIYILGAKVKLLHHHKHFPKPHASLLSVPLGGVAEEAGLQLEEAGKVSLSEVRAEAGL